MTLLAMLKTFRKKNPIKITSKHSNIVVNNFYGKESVVKQAKRQGFIHYVLKYKIVIPSLFILKKIIGKRLVRKAPEEPQFKYIKLFETIYDKSVIEWSNIYLNALRKPSQKLSKKKWKELYEKQEWGSHYFIRTIKELANTLFVNDDAYAEFIPFFLWETYFQMRKLVEAGEKDHLMRNVHGEMNPLHEMIYLQLTKKIPFKVEVAGRQKAK